MTVRIINGDCLDVLRTLPDASVDSCVTDPPYGLKFMGNAWDHGIPGTPYWIEVLRVLKPGAYLLAFGGTRTYHRLACAIEDAGFEIRDMVAWLYGQGFPKGTDKAKISPAWKGWNTALKPALEPICFARKPMEGTLVQNLEKWGTGAIWIDGCRIEVSDADERDVGREITRNVRQEDGWGMNGGAAQSGVCVVKPEGRWPANVLLDGSEEVLACFPDSLGQQARARTDGEAQGNGVYGALNHVTTNPEPRNDTGSAARFFKECRFSEDDQWPPHESNAQAAKSVENPSSSCATPTAAGAAETKTSDFKSEELPASRVCTENCENSIQHPKRASVERPVSIDTIQTTASHSKLNGCAPPATGENTNSGNRAAEEGDSGPVAATRFRYCPKASREDRNEGLRGMATKPPNWSSGEQSPGTFQSPNTNRQAQNHHPTVKPTDLMRYLCRLVTPPGGTVLDPFMGSGSTLKGAELEGFSAIGIEVSTEYCDIARRRIAADAPLFAEVTA